MMEFTKYQASHLPKIRQATVKYREDVLLGNKEFCDKTHYFINHNHYLKHETLF